MSSAIDSFCRIPISIIAKYGEQIPFDVYLRLSDNKVVKISHSEENIVELFNKYRAKGVQDVFASKESYVTFLKHLKDQLSFKLFDPSTTVDEQVDVLSGSYKVIKESFKKLGVSQESIDVAKEVAKSSQKIVHNYPNIFEFYNRYKNNCGSEYMRSILIGFISSCMLDFFDWKTDSIKEKANLAALLRDILLDEQQFEELHQAEATGLHHDLSREIKEHPLQVAAMLEDKKGTTWVAKEVLTIIEQHHELPSGKGFPRGLNHQRINQLSSIHIVADNFIRLMIQEKFNMGARDRILYQLSDKFSGGNFKKAMQSLYQALGMKG